ncbi:T9SS type A sorting domain-containing protein [Tenacibaculum sp. M341]|uniref:T9SS type A sorting domain-containing protein n=1 Tax=Tenacibaculum sp. M341 TaxID=2530339 RepID=UPI0010478EEB|nr:T9SS type A sorting domain-containing protein [Tenacibaculum sp. M341]TCI93755.1 T9SS type A sorting domain-containing protein [Tenacibaculum sp. M341]
MKQKISLFVILFLSFLAIQSQQCKDGDCQSIAISTSGKWSVSHGTPSWGTNSVWMWSYSVNNQIYGEGVNYSGHNFVQGVEYCISFTLNAQTNNGALPNANSSMNVFLTPNTINAVQGGTGDPLPAVPTPNQQIMSQNIWSNGNGSQTYQFTFTASSNFSNIWFAPSNPAAPNPQIEVTLSDLNICQIPPCKEEIKLVKVGECDPCESGVYIMQLVDGSGNLITNFNSITWSDGLYPNQNTRIANVNTAYAVSVEIPSTNDRVCTYETEFYYECEKKCDDLQAPINLKNYNGTLTWDPVPGAVSYIVSSPSRINVRCCADGISIAPIQTATNSVTLSSKLKGSCFVWQVVAVCADGTQSPVSKQLCHMPEGLISIDDDVIGLERESLPKEKVSIYPNPNHGDVHIKVETVKDSNVGLQIFRLDGTLVQKVNNVKTENGVLDYDLHTDLPKGMYIFKINTSNGTTTKQVVIEK